MNRIFNKKIWMIYAAVTVAALWGSVSPAGAWTSTTYHTTHHHDTWDSRDERQMQADRIAAQEEARREEAREKRRDEIEQERKTNENEYLASRAAVWEASRAAARAPRDFFYRRPGFATSSLPAGHKKLEVGGVTYFYDRGIFFRSVGEKYIAVAAPPGAMVEELPEGVRGALFKDESDTYSYYFGTFFVKENGGYKVVAPPPGTLVGYIPDGYTETEVGGAKVMHFGETGFQPAFYQGQVVYQVLKG